MDLSALTQEAETFEVPQAPWFNQWHKHVDWDGEGNSDPAMRQACANALITCFGRVLEQVSADVELQVWMRFESDSGQDALYLHSPNPHTEYPYQFEDVEWGVDAPEFLKAGLEGESVEIGRSEYDGYNSPNGGSRRWNDATGGDDC